MVLVVVELEGCLEVATLDPWAKVPPDERDSPARESDVTTPAPSALGFWNASGSLVTWDKYC